MADLQKQIDPRNAPNDASRSNAESGLRIAEHPVRRPLQEKKAVATNHPKTLKGADDVKMEDKGGDESMVRKRGKLGPPSRQAKSNGMEVENDERGEEISPDFSLSLNPKAQTSSPPNASKQQALSPKAVELATKSISVSDLYPDSSSTDSSMEEEIEMRDQTVIDSVFMDLSHTIILSHPTPKPSHHSSHQPHLATHHKHIDRTEKIEASKNNIIVNGKSYVRGGLIGKGGSCKVFKITDEEGTIFALKKVKLRGQDVAVVEGYKNEIILLNKLKANDRIIRLYDAEHDAEQNVLMMVLIE